MALMASSPSFELRKCPRVEEQGEHEDRISRLPDEILCHILSFLPTKHFVRTSVFSKRWSRIWTSVPVVEINYHSLVPADFIDRVLRLNVSCLRKFSLDISNDDWFVDSEWVRAAFMRDVEELDLSLEMLYFDPEDRVEFPLSFFTSKKLVILKLSDWRGNLDFILNLSAAVNVGRARDFEFPLSIFTNKKLVILKLYDWRKENNIILNLHGSVVSLPSLKILHLRSIKFLDDNSMNNLIDGCPVLEELDIEVGHDNCKTLTISSNSLRSVRVRSWYSCSINIPFRIVLDTKNLEGLNLDYHVTVLYDVKSLSPLENVNLTGGCRKCSKIMGTKVHVNHSRLVELIRKLSRTKHMFISCEEILSPLESSQLNDLHLPMFHNLTHLKFDSFKDSWKVLSYLFERLPSLITFEFHRANFCKQRWRQPCRQFHAPECLMLNLEEVILTEFRACADEIEMVSYFLKSATSLKKMSIQSSYKGSQKMLEISQQLLTFERGSNKCQIIFN